MRKRACIIVSGLVQGVFFRAHAQRVASELGLRGYVRNLANGDVEIVAEGEEDRLDRLIEWAKQGPPRAEVKGVRAQFFEPAHTFTGFSIRY